MSTLFFAPVRQDPPVLRLFLDALAKVDGIDEYLFIDDNDVRESSAMLEAFRIDRSVSVDGKTRWSRTGKYEKGVKLSHEWTEDLMERMSELRNYGLEYFRSGCYSHMLTADSDIILPSNLFRVLERTGAEIVSAVYWTKWTDDAPYLPQVWDIHNYFFDSPGSAMKFREPGQYQVNGLGGCTLLRAGIPKGVDYTRVPGIHWPGEDRHFCIRAACAGVKLMANTEATPFHIYRPEQLAEAIAWYATGSSPDYFREKWLGNGWRRVFEQEANSSQRSAVSQRRTR